MKKTNQIDSFYLNKNINNERRFQSSPSTLLPPPLSTIQATDRSGEMKPRTASINQKIYRSAYSNSTLADSKQLDEDKNYSNYSPSSVVYDYQQQYQTPMNGTVKESSKVYFQTNDEDIAENYYNEEELEYGEEDAVVEEAEEREEPEEMDGEEEVEEDGEEETEGYNKETYESEDPELQYDEYDPEENHEEIENLELEGQYEYDEQQQKQRFDNYMLWNKQGHDILDFNQTKKNILYNTVSKTNASSDNTSQMLRSRTMDHPFMHTQISWENANEEGNKEVVSRHSSAQYQQEPNRETYKKKQTIYDEKKTDLETEENTDTEDINGILMPFSIADIDRRIEIRVVSGKGRCAFARRDYKPGDIIFIELPTLVATPELDAELWATLSVLNKEKAFELPPVWHLAALYSLLYLPQEQKKIIFDKWVPDVHKKPTEDVLRVLKYTQLPVDPGIYERALQVWRYNSFGHHVSSDGLVLYNKISMLSHDCAASACWHYGINDAFTLRARQYIQKGQEINISYVGDEDLLKATHIRQEKLSGWLFKCGCQRCKLTCDSARGFRCPTCGTGSIFFKTDKDINDSVTPDATKSTHCTLCKIQPTVSDIDLYLHLEEAYISRLAETSKEDLLDAEHVYSEAQRVFVQHWVLFQLETILFEAYRDQNKWNEAIFCQMNRIRYVLQVIPEVSYTLAWLYEELGDLHARNIGVSSNSTEEQETSTIASLNGFQKNVLVDKYETAMNMLLVLCGSEHEYTRAAHEKLETVFELGKGCFGEE